MFSGLAGFGLMIYSVMGIVITIFLFVKMSKNENYGLLALGFFLIQIIFGLIVTILLHRIPNARSPFVLTMISGLISLAIALFSVVPVNNIDDSRYYTSIIKGASVADYVMLGVCAFGLLLFLIAAV